MNSNTPPLPESALLSTAIQHLSRRGATCKLVCVILSSATLFFAMARSGGETLLWVLAPAGFLAFADAGYRAQARILAATAQKLDGIGGAELIRLQVAVEGFTGVRMLCSGLLSLTVWPFYLGLATLVAVLGNTVLVSKTPPLGAPFYQPSSMPAQMQPFNRPYPTNPGPPGAVPQPGSVGPHQGSRFPNTVPPWVTRLGPSGNPAANGQSQGAPTAGPTPASKPGTGSPRPAPTPQAAPVPPTSPAPAK